MCHSQGEQVKPPSTRVVVTNRGDEPGEPGGQTGSFPSPKISNHYEPNELSNKYQKTFRLSPISPISVPDFPLRPR